MNMKFNFIVIEGNIGSGKTSLSKKIVNNFNGKLILEEFADNPFLPKFYKEAERNAFPLELSFMAERFQQLSGEKSKADLFTEFRISDYSFFKSTLFAKNNLKEDELNLFNQLYHIMFSSVRKPDLLVYLHSKVGRLQENIKKRGRDYENSISIDYLSRLNERYEAWTQTYTKGKILVIDVDNLDFVKNKEDLKLIISKVDNSLKGLN